MSDPFIFGLPPSGAETQPRAEKVHAALATHGCERVVAKDNYSALVRDLLEGHIQVAWAPPLVCARVEQAGGRVVLRALRAGAATYRAVLYARADRGLTKDTLANTVAAWVEPGSMAGCVLPRAFIRQGGQDPDRAFKEQMYLGSFAACVQAVLEGRADVSATYATSDWADQLVVGYQSLAGMRAQELTALAYSEDSPNDGVVLSPALKPARVTELEEMLTGLVEDRDAWRTFTRALRVEALEVPEPGSYAPLADLWEAGL